MKITDSLVSLFRGITFRLALITTLILIIFVHVGVGLALYRVHGYLMDINRAYIVHFNNSHSAGIDAPILQALQAPPAEAKRIIGEEMKELGGISPQISHYSIVTAAAKPRVVFLFGASLPEKMLFAMPKETNVLFFENVEHDGRNLLLASRPIKRDGTTVAILRVAAEVPTYVDLLRERATRSMALMATLVASIFLVSFLLVGFVTRSMRKVVHQIQSFDKDSFPGEIAVSSADEAGKVAEAFNRMSKRLHSSYVATLGALASLLETKDRVTETHSLRVVNYAVELGRAFGLSQRDIIDLEYGALLHDIGKVGVDDSILRKSGPLTEEEWHVIRQHPTIGYSVLKDLEFLRKSLPVVLHHQERYDGRGYPNGLSGDDIPVLARIFTIADSFEAMISDRPYRKAMKPEQAIQEIRRNAGTQFDPKLAEIFSRLFAEGKIRVDADASLSFAHHLHN